MRQTRPIRALVSIIGPRYTAAVSASELGSRVAQVSWTWMLRQVVVPAADQLAGHPMMNRLRYLERAQWWSEEKLGAERDEKVRALVQTLDQIPFYRELMAQRGVRPSGIRGVVDLTKLPVTTKAMLRSGFPDRVTRPTGQRTYKAVTSGSTGTNFAVLEDQETAGHYRAAFMLALEWAGWSFGEPHLQTGITPDRSPARRIKDTLLRCSYFTANDLSDSALDEQLRTIERKGLQHVWGYPGSLFYLARRARQRGWNRPLVSVVSWGDTLFPSFREEIERTFGARVTDTYGLGEGVQIAAQCERGNYHEHALDTIVEYLDDEGGPVPEGSLGHVTITRLHPGPMPLVRYQPGDYALNGHSRRCACGRAFPILEGIKGRAADVVLTPSGNRLIVHFFTGILEFFKEIESFQVEQNELSGCSIRYVLAPGATREFEPRLISRLREKGADLEIRVERVEAIPMTRGGKHRFVISTLAAGSVAPSTTTP